jgi:predicted deacylase
MHRIDHPLLCASLGSQKTLTSLHFGQQGMGPKVYIQASLHAEELPGMLTAYHLRDLLGQAERKGLFLGHVVLVPVANPIGLAQRLDHKPMGRFELGTSENFNRNYPQLADVIGTQLLGELGLDATVNVALVRKAVSSYLQAWQPATELASLRHRLIYLAHDADRVLDLHCDCEAVLHFYCEPPCWPGLEPLARLLGSEAVLLASESGGASFDECLSSVWWKLAEQLQRAGQDAALPQACCSATVELRGESDVSDSLALQDAQAIYSYLQHEGVIACESLPHIPSARCEPTPLAGSQTLRSVMPGLVVFSAKLGQRMEKGDLVAEVIDPLGNVRHPIVAGVSGTFYARVRDRYVAAGGELGKIAGTVPYRTGNLLGA